MEELDIRPFRKEDESRVIELWETCNLVVPWNDPGMDIQVKLENTPDQLLVAEIQHQLVGSCMFGYDGHRGWIYYLAVLPDHQHRGTATRMMAQAEVKLKNLGCPKINIMIRDSNKNVLNFYEKIGYNKDPVTVVSKRLQTEGK